MQSHEEQTTSESCNIDEVWICQRKTTIWVKSEAACLVKWTVPSEQVWITRLQGQGWPVIMWLHVQGQRWPVIMWTMHRVRANGHASCIFNLGYPGIIWPGIRSGIAIWLAYIALASTMRQTGEKLSLTPLCHTLTLSPGQTDALYISSETGECVGPRIKYNSKGTAMSESHPHANDPWIFLHSSEQHDLDVWIRIPSTDIYRVNMWILWT